MAVEYVKVPRKARKMKDGPDRPAFTFQGINKDKIATDSIENLAKDLLEISGGDLKKIADYTVEGFNAAKEFQANPFNDPLVKVVLDSAKSMNRTITVEQAIRKAESMRKEMESEDVA